MSEARFVKISMPYPGDAISVNHYLGQRQGGGYYIKQEAQAWIDTLGHLINNWQARVNTNIAEWSLPLHVTCDGKFIDANHAPDLSNLSKVTLDAIQEVTGINDRDMRWHDGFRVLKKDEDSELIITIEEALA